MFELLLNVMGPVVLIIALGWLAGRRISIDVNTLSKLAFYVLGPAFVLDVFADAELDGSVVVRLTIAALIGMIAGGLVAYAAARGSGFDQLRTGAAVMTGSFGNVGNAGLAISAFAFGDSAIPAAAVLMIVINISGVFVGVVLASAREKGIGSALVRALAAPISIAATVAVLFNVIGVDFPLSVERSISILGTALIPIMLLTLGIQMAGDRQIRLERDLGVVSVAKLIAAPAVAGLAGWLLGLEGETFGVLVIQSAMPPAVFCSVVALEFAMEPERVTRTVLGTTLVALLTLPVVLIAVT